MNTTEQLLDTPTKQYEYAGFWLRFVAVLLDAIILAVAPVIISVFTFGLGLIILMPVLFLYFPLCHSSKNGATLGKRAMGIKVLRSNGERIEFLRAFGRFLARILSSLLFCIGYIMAGFTSKKQALHDMICDTIVVKS